MKTLQELLDLPEESRLTGVFALPHSRDRADGHARIVMHVARGLSESSDVAGPALARSMPDTAIVLGGVLLDGTDWCATFEYAEVAYPEFALESRAHRGLARALDLTGVGARKLVTTVLLRQDLANAYEASGAPFVGDWSTLDLLLGMIINLWRGDLSSVPASLDDATCEPWATSRRARLDSALRDWAAHYTGPEPADS